MEQPTKVAPRKASLKEGSPSSKARVSGHPVFQLGFLIATWVLDLGADELFQELSRVPLLQKSIHSLEIPGFHLRVLDKLFRWMVHRGCRED